MAEITRQTHKIFGGTGSSDNFAKFGSLVAGAPVKTKDIATIQALPAWDAGFQEAIYGANKDLLLEDLNSYCFEHSRQIAYLFQDGIAAWDAGTSYYEGSLVKATDGSGDVYVSLQDDNLNNAIPGHAGNAFWAWWNPSGPGSGLDADTVDGIHASTVPVANKLLALNADGQFPSSVFAGALIQSLRVKDATFRAIVQHIPQDDSIPQSSEGYLLLTQAITPKTAGNKIRVRALVPAGTQEEIGITIALFKNAGVDAVAANAGWFNNSIGTFFNIPLDFELIAPDTTVITFTLRVGGTGSTIGINGPQGGRWFGGVMEASMTVEEIAA